MMKKIMAAVLALMMLVLPVLGSAATTQEMMEDAQADGKATRTQVTFVPGDLTLLLGEENATLFGDMLNALSLDVYSHGDESSAAVSLQGAEVLRTDIAIDDDDTFYLRSNLLGDDVLAVTQDEWQVLLEKTIDLMVATEAMSAFEAAQIKQSLAALFAKDNPAARLGATMNAMDWLPVLDQAMAILASGERTSVTEQPEGCDPAAVKMSFTIEAEDVVNLYTALSECLTKNAALMEILNRELATSGMTAESLLAQLVDAVKEASADMEAIPVVCYLDADNELVRLDMTAKADVDGETAALSLAYSRYTEDWCTAHTVASSAKAMNLEVLGLNLTYYDAGDAGALSGSIAMSADTDEGIKLSGSCIYDDESVELSVMIDALLDDEPAQVYMTLKGSDKDMYKDVAFNLEWSNSIDQWSLALQLEEENTSGETSATSKCKMDGVLTFLGQTIGLAGEYTANAEATDDGVKQDGVCDVKLNMMGMEMPLLSVKMSTQTCDAQESIVSADALHLAAMTDEELENWSTTVMQNMQLTMITALQKLPVSVLQMLMEQ